MISSVVVDVSSLVVMNVVANDVPVEVTVMKDVESVDAAGELVTPVLTPDVVVGRGKTAVA